MKSLTVKELQVILAGMPEDTVVYFGVKNMDKRAKANTPKKVRTSDWDDTPRNAECLCSIGGPIAFY